MSVHPPFAGMNPRPSPWGYNWTVDEVRVPARQPSEVPARQPEHNQASAANHSAMADQYAHMPAALLSTLKREKKPFTYTPGGVNLSEVLNARLQKRIERKKKYSEDRELQQSSTKQVIVMPTYNTPLDMYSMANALEALEVQAELATADKSLSSTLPRNHTFRFEEKDLDPGRGVAQSKAFRVLQIITDTEEASTEKPQSQHRDEMRFTSIRESKVIPSKFFHTLQKITGTDNIDSQEDTTQRSGVMFEKQTFPVPKQQSDTHHQPVSTSQQPYGAAPTLKRPAAFLPLKMSSSFKPVVVSNGSRRKTGHPGTGTDF